jgi:uncharacterized protein YndB with AHSA1/START domain
MSNDFVYTTFIRTTPEKLWSAITNPEFTRQYWGQHANISDWKKGSEWEHRFATDNTLRVKGKVLEIDPPKRLVLSWFAPSDEADTSVVTYQIEPAGEMVRLDVIHGSFKPGSVMAGKVSQGWPLVLSSLKSFLETGKPIDILAIKTGCSDDQAA